MAQDKHESGVKGAPNSSNNSAAGNLASITGKLADDTAVTGRMEHESTVEPVVAATADTLWTDTQLLEYLVHRAERAERSGDARRGAHHLALVHDIILRKCATVQELVTEELHKAMNKDEPTAMSSNTNDTNNRDDCCRRGTSNDEALQSGANEVADGVGSAAAAESTPVFDPFAQTLMLPPGLDEADYLEEHAFLSSEVQQSHMSHLDPLLTRSNTNGSTASAFSAAPTISPQARLGQVVDGLVEALRKTPLAALPLREMAAKQEKAGEEGDDVMWARLRLTSRLGQTGGSKTNNTTHDDKNMDDNDIGVSNLAKLHTIRVLLIYHTAALLWRSGEVAAAQVWLSQLDELAPLHWSKSSLALSLSDASCGQLCSATHDHDSKGGNNNDTSYDNDSSVTREQRPVERGASKRYSRSAFSSVSLSSSSSSAAASSHSSSPPHEDASFLSLSICPCEPVSENTATARYQALCDRAMALRAIVTRVQSCTCVSDIMQLIQEAISALHAAQAHVHQSVEATMHHHLAIPAHRSECGTARVDAREVKAWRSCLYGVMRRAVRVYLAGEATTAATKSRSDNHDANNSNSSSGSCSGITASKSTTTAERCDELLRALHVELSERSRQEDRRLDGSTRHGNWFLQHLIYMVHKYKEADYNNRQQKQQQHEQDEHESRQVSGNNNNNRSTMVAAVPEISHVAAAAHPTSSTDNYALRPRGRTAKTITATTADTPTVMASSWPTLALLLCRRGHSHVMRVSTQRVRAVAQALHTAIHLLQGELRARWGEAWWLHWRAQQVQAWESFYADTAPVNMVLLASSSLHSTTASSHAASNNYSSSSSGNHTDDKNYSTSGNMSAVPSTAANTAAAPVLSTDPWRVAIEEEDSLHGSDATAGKTRHESSRWWWARPLPPVLCAAELRERRRQQHSLRSLHSQEWASREADHGSHSSNNHDTDRDAAKQHRSPSRPSCDCRHANPNRHTSGDAGVTSWAARASQMMLRVTGAMHAHWYPSPTRRLRSPARKRKDRQVPQHGIPSSAMKAFAHTPSPSVRSSGTSASCAACPQQPADAVVALALNVPPPFTPSLTMDVSGFTTTSQHTYEATLALVREMTQQQRRIDSLVGNESSDGDDTDTANDTHTTTTTTTKTASQQRQQRVSSFIRGGVLSFLFAPIRRRLHDELPILQQHRSWRVIYHTEVHGTSMNALLRSCEAAAAASAKQNNIRYNSNSTNSDNSMNTGSRCPMLLVLEVAPSMTLDFASDGAGVRDAQRWSSAPAARAASKQDNTSYDSCHHGSPITHDVDDDDAAKSAQGQPHRLVIGAFLSHALDADAPRYYGSADTFVFHALLDEYFVNDSRTNARASSSTCSSSYRTDAFASSTALRVYHSSGANQQYIHCRRHHGIVIGGSGGEGGTALWIDASLQRGATAGCVSFDSPPLTRWCGHEEETSSNGSVSFDIVHMEVLVMDE